MEGDFVLHALQVEDVLIVSTSKSLSTHIVATASGIKQPKSIALSKTDTRHGEITGRLIGLYIDMAQRWIPALVGAVRAPEATTKLNNWLFWSQLSYDFLRKIGWQESGRGRRYTGHLEFTWR